jgi:hypothetical protein
MRTATNDDKVNDSNFDDYLAFLCEAFENLDIDIITLYLLKSNDVTDALNGLKTFVLEKESLLSENAPKLDGLRELFPECEPDYLSSFICAHQVLNLFELSDLLVEQLVGLTPKPKQKHKFIPLKDFVMKANLSDNSSQLCYNKSLFYNNDYSTNIHSSQFSRNSSTPSRFPFEFDFGCEKPEESHEYYRGLVDELNIERNELFEKAARAFSLSNLEGYSSAAFYSQKARAINADIKKYKALAALTTFSHYNPDPFSSILDLHGLTVNEALPLVSAFIKHHLVDLKVREVFLITGRGVRSKNGIRLKPAVYHLLKEQKWPFNLENESTFVVYKKNKI